MRCRDRSILATFLVANSEVSFIRMLFLSFLASLMFALCAEAAPIYSQTTPEEPVGAFGSQDIPGGQRVADNFVIEGSGQVTVRSIRFIGGYINTSPPPLTPPLDALPSDNFRFVFLNDSGDGPGSIVAGGDLVITAPYSQTPTYGQMLNGISNPIEFVVNLGEGVVLTSGTEYWLTITNNIRPDYGWAWARADGILDNVTAGTRNDIAIGPWDLFENGGMFFELNDQTIPEPSTVIIVLLALSGCKLFFSRYLRASV